MSKQYNIGDLWTICHHIGVAVMVIDDETDTLVFVNDRVIEDLHLDREKIEGASLYEAFFPEFHQFYSDLASRCDIGKRAIGQFYWTERAIWEQVNVIKAVFRGRRVVVMTITNVSEIAQAEYEYRQIVFFDPTTGLPNARKLEEDIAEIAGAEEVSLVFFEIDRLDDIYDVHGWEAGDTLLYAIRDWLNETKLPRSHLYRVNDGFLLLGRMVTKEDMFHRAKVIKERFAEPWVVPLGGNDFSLYCTIKIGLVYGKYVHNEMRNIIMRTVNLPDYDDKGYTLYDEEVDEKVKKVHRMRSELITSIFNEMTDFEVLYHPIVEAKTYKWIGAEALCRWTSPTFGPVSPICFIPQIEHLGLIGELDSWVRRKAMGLCREFGLNEREFFLDVNHSPSQPMDEAFASKLIKEADSHDFPLEHLILEITESERMQFDDVTMEVLENLRRMGILISLDDFGSGYSSIENLIKISACTLKTDMLLVENLEDDPHRRHLIKTLIDLAHSLDMKIVIEGVETKGQRDLLEAYGADFMQGYLFSKPMTRQQLESVLSRF